MDIFTDLLKQNLPKMPDATGFFHLVGLLLINSEAKPILYCALCRISVHDLLVSKRTLRFSKTDRVTARLALSFQFFGDDQLPVRLVVFAAGLWIGQSNDYRRSAVAAARTQCENLIAHILVIQYKPRGAGHCR